MLLLVSLLLAAGLAQEETLSSEPVSSSSAAPVSSPTDPLSSSPELVSSATTSTPPLAAVSEPGAAPDAEPDPGAEGGVSGTTVVTLSSTKIDATTVVLISSTTTTVPASAETSPQEQEVTSQEPRDGSSVRPTVDTGWRTTSTTTRAPGRRPQPSPSAPPASDGSGATCDFGLYPSTTMCGWRSLHAGRSTSSPRWRPGSGMANNWIGGPRVDFEPPSAPGADGGREPPPVGGYAFVETSEGANVEEAGDRAFLISPPLPASGVQGTCLSFMYSLAGLSARGLRVLLASNSSRGASLRELWHTPPPHAPGDTWMQGQLLYTEPRPHQLLLEASCSPALDASRSYRGHVAVDAVSLVPGGSCPDTLTCTFAAGLCRWKNAAALDDFDWTMGRGSSSTVTGPAAPADSWVEPQHATLPKQHFQVAAQGRDLQDHDVTEGLEGLEGLEVQDGDLRSYPGGYVFIDSSYPRRPGDTARLESPPLPPTDPLFPSCLRFWFHMYGVDVGSLRWLLVPEASSSNSSTGRVVWSMSGDAGNAWFRGAVTLAEPHPFRVVVEASVGAVGMSDIAVDNIILEPGPCPVSPQVAGALERLELLERRRAPRVPPDCSLEVDECGWRGAGGASLWERVAVSGLPPALQRRPHGPGLRNDYFLGLQMSTANSASPPASTQLVSQPITSQEDPLCLAFWYLVHEPARDMSTGLGALRVRVTEVLDTLSPPAAPLAPPLAPPPPPQSAVVWALYNTQGPAWRPARVPLPANWTFTVSLEGEWGPARRSGVLAVDDIVLYHSKCPVVPSSALSSPADCSFSLDTCSWSSSSSSSSWPAWQHAGGQHRPARLSDNTFQAPGGYVFFDMFSLSKMPRRARLQSAALDAGDPVCFSFWFAAFGQGESTRLRVIRVDDKLQEAVVWRLNARGMDTARPHWLPAQASLSASTAFSIVLEGEASNGGFAVDDIRVRPGSCQTRPSAASP